MARHAAPTGSRLLPVPRRRLTGRWSPRQLPVTPTVVEGPWRHGMTRVLTFCQWIGNVKGDVTVNGIVRVRPDGG